MPDIPQYLKDAQDSAYTKARWADLQSLEDLRQSYAKQSCDKRIKFIEPTSQGLELTGEELEHYRLTRHSTYYAKEGDNRWQNILPYEIYGVQVSQFTLPGRERYLNMSVVRQEVDQRPFLVPSAPLEHTMHAFISAIIQERARVVVQLTESKEREQIKAEPWFPLKKNGFESTHKDPLSEFTFSVGTTNLVELHEGKFTVRTLRIQTIDEEEGEPDGKLVYDVVHIWYHGWPDYDVPEDDLDLVRLINLMFEYNAQPLALETFKIPGEKTVSFNPEPPMVVHCSAGAGRAGTLVVSIATLATLELLPKYTMSNSDNDYHAILPCKVGELSPETLSDVIACATNYAREQRGSMVLTLAQYELIYKVVEKALEARVSKKRRREDSQPDGAALVKSDAGGAAGDVGLDAPCPPKLQRLEEGSQGSTTPISK